MKPQELAQVQGQALQRGGCGDEPEAGQRVGGLDLVEADGGQVSEQAVEAVHGKVVPSFRALTKEYEAGETTEAQVARDADKIETLLQAIEYGAAGYDTAAWRETSLAALRTEAGKQLAQAIGPADPRWWSVFAATYRELRADAQRRARSHAPEGQ